MPDKSPLDVIRDKIRELLAERDNHQQRMDAVLSGVEQRGDDAVLNEDEHKQFTEARDAIKAIDEQRKGFEQQEAAMLEAEDARQAAAEASKRYGGSDAPTPVRVTSEPATYRKGGPHSFFRDAHVVTRGAAFDPGAAERIARHQRENIDRLREERATNTGSFGSLVVPQFLTEMFAPLARAGRPLLNTLDPMELPPEGTALNIPRGTTGTIVGSQSGENTAVSEQDFDETTLTVNMKTIAGQQDISRQSLDRGTPGLDQIIMRDLAAAYATELDRQVINGTGTNGQHLGLLSITAIDTVTFSETGASNRTVSKAYSKLADAVQRINSSRFLPATAICMHPRRWGWFTAASDSTGRPLALANSQMPQNAIGVGEAASYGQVVGTLLNLPVITDANIPTSVSSSTASGTSEDVIVVYRAPDLHLWEDAPEPQMVEFRETLAGNLTVKVVAWSYSFFTGERYPTATVIISGSNLTTPTF